MRFEKRKGSRIDNDNTVKYIKINDDNMKWEVLDFSIRGIRVISPVPKNYRKDQTVDLEIYFKSGKRILKKARIGRTNVDGNCSEMGLEIVNS